MPKQIKELKIFKEGLISNASSLDIPDEAAAFSQNIDPETEGGTIGGVSKDKILSEDGVTNPEANIFKVTIPEIYRSSRACTWTKETSDTTGWTDSSTDTYIGWNPYGGWIVVDSVSIVVTSNSGTAGNGTFTNSSSDVTITQGGKISMTNNAFASNCKMVITYTVGSLFVDTAAIDRQKTYWPNASVDSYPTNSVMVLRTGEGLRNIYIQVKTNSSGINDSPSKFYTDHADDNTVVYSNEIAPKWKDATSFTSNTLDLYISSWDDTIDSRKQIRDLFVTKWNALSGIYLSNDDTSTYLMSQLCKASAGSDDYTVNLTPQSIELNIGENINQYGPRVTELIFPQTLQKPSTLTKRNITGVALNSRIYDSESLGGGAYKNYTVVTVDSFSSPNWSDGWNIGTNVWLDVDSATEFNVVPGVYTITNMSTSGTNRIELYNLPSNDGVLDTISGPINNGVWDTNGNPPFDLEIEEGKGLQLEATDIGIMYDGDTSNLLAFDSNSNSLHAIEDIDNVEDSTNSPRILREGVTHNGSASIVPYNKEARVGYGHLRGSSPNWVGKIQRKQLDKDLNDLYVENQELASPNEELAGFNYDKLIVPYLPPRDEMGKRWYQSQVIDMKYGGDNANAAASNEYEYPAYQSVLRDGINLGDVDLPSPQDGGAYEALEDKALFDYNDGTATPSATAQADKNVVTMALNNHNDGDAAGLIIPFEGLTFAIGDSVDTNALTSPLLMGAKKRFYNHTNVRVAPGDVYMITQIAHTNGACTHIDVMFMGNVATGDGTLDADNTNLQGCGPAFGIGLNKGQQNLSYVNLWRNPGNNVPHGDTTWGDTKTIPLNNLFGETMSGEISAINWSHSYMTTTLDAAGKKRKINKKYGTVIFAQNDQNTSLFRFDLHLNSNNTSETAGPDNPKLSLEDSTIILDFSKIPNKLKEDGKKIIDPPIWDSEMGDDTWSKFPKDSYITDICDTWSRRDADDAGDAFNYYGNVTASSSVKGTYEPNGNYLTWIMYSKRVYEDEYKDWDMFLFNYEASGNTESAEKIWLDPQYTGAVYVKDRTPPYTECIKTNVKRQTSRHSRPVYRNRERTGHNKNTGHNVQTGAIGTSYWRIHNGTIHHGDGADFWVRSAKNVGSDNIASWANCLSNANDSGNDNDINFGSNLGWLQGNTRKIQTMPGTLTPYEPRFECVGIDNSDKAFVAHNQGHRVLFAGNLSGTFITTGGRMKPSKGYAYSWDLVPYAGTQRWWSGAASGSTREYSQSLNIFTIKDISVKSTTNPTDWYGSGGERELGSAMVGGADVSDHSLSTSQHSKDIQTSVTSSDLTRKDGDYVNINRLFSLEQSRDYSNTDNEDVRGYYPANTSYMTDGSSPGTIIATPFGTSAGGSGSKSNLHNLGFRVTNIKYHGQATSNGDYYILNNNLHASAKNQYNVIYEIDPIVTMNTIENTTNQSILNIRNMQTIVVPTDGSTAQYMNDFKRVLVVSGNCIENEDEGAKTYISAYQLNKHQMFTTETADEHAISTTISSTSKDGDFIGDIATLESGLKGSNTKEGTTSGERAMGSDGSAITQWNSAAAEIGELRCLGGASKVYNSSRMKFINMHTHFLGSKSERNYSSTGIFGTGVYSPIIYGETPDGIKTLVSKVADDGSDLNPFQLNGLQSTGVLAAETEGASGSSVTLTVDTVAATSSVFLNKVVYKSDGTIFGTCTAVNSTTEIVFGAGLTNGITNNDVLYVDNYSNAGGIASTGNDLDADAIYSQDGLVTFDLDTGDTGESFTSGSIIYYKLSLTYDGHQESPLSQFTIPSTQLTYSQKEMTLSLNINNASAFGLNKRVTHINVYFTDDLVLKPWTLAKSVSLDVNLNPLWVYNDSENRWKHRIKHVNSGATYESLNGISSNRARTMVNWGLAKRMGNYYVYGDCSHPKLSENVTNYLFRSKAGRPDVVDWVNDYLILPTKPIAIESFRGKLYAWDNKDLYIINQEGFYVEDVMKGVGIMGKKAVVATEFGMCFADINNIYLHDGVSLNPIGDPILRNTLHREWRVGYIDAMQIALKQNHDVNVLYDAESNSFLVTTKGFCGADGCDVNSNQRKGARAYSFSVNKQRWDYVEVPNVKAFAQGMRNRVYLVDGNNIWEHKTLHTEKRDWEWHSKNMSFGSDTQLKSFTKIKTTGSPSSDYTTPEGVNVLCIKAFVDGSEKTLTPENKNFTESDSGLSSPSLTDSATTFTTSAGDVDLTYNSIIGKGMYLKIDNEIVLVTDTSIDYTADVNSRMTVTIARAQLGTTAASHSSLSSIYIVAPSYKLPSGTKGYKMRIELHNQSGKLDSLGFIFRGKGIK